MARRILVHRAKGKRAPRGASERFAALLEALRCASPVAGLTHADVQGNRVRKLWKRKLLKRALAKESALVAADSLEVLGAFERLEDELSK